MEVFQIERVLSVQKSPLKMDGQIFTAEEMLCRFDAFERGRLEMQEYTAVVESMRVKLDELQKKVDHDNKIMSSIIDTQQKLHKCIRGLVYENKKREAEIGAINLQSLLMQAKVHKEKQEPIFKWCDHGAGKEKQAVYAYPANPKKRLIGVPGCSTDALYPMITKAPVDVVTVKLSGVSLKRTDATTVEFGSDTALCSESD